MTDTPPAATPKAETRAEQIARVHYTEDGRRRWPFEGVATLLDAPLDEAAAKDPASSSLDIALLGVPFDLGVTNRAGARLGPRAVRAIERIGPHEPVLDLVPLALARVADIGDIPLPSRYSLERCHEAIEAFIGRLARAGIRPLVVGGDHSITGPILKALGRGRPLGLIQIDAHADTAGPYEGTGGHHGAPFREAALAGVLDPKRTIQIGIRGGVTWLWEYSRESGMTIVPMHEVETLGIAGVIARARAVIGDGPCYLSFDIDALDPAFAPGTGTPEVGGFTTREAIALLRGLAGLDIVAGDVVEVAPQYDPTTVTAQAAAQILFQILCLMVRAPSFRPRT
ncbi:agmatinase [Elioraea thermophila]|uniref:agmatinase n=1 Tax=Elioraea thermophila TaxID=2185104 RepID=UPI000DF3D5DC|nr:agmatinase [Elioraea thermophila]